MMTLKKTAQRYALAAALAVGVALGIAAARWMEWSATRAQEPKISAHVLEQEVGRLPELSRSFRLVAEHVAPSVVFISASAPAIVREFGFFLEQGQSTQSGSGVVIDADGRILTNYHVVNGARSIRVRFADGREEPGDVIATDPDMDLAVVKVKAGGLVPARLGDSSKVEVGDWVLAVGNPFGLDHSVSAGIISAKNRKSSNSASYLMGDEGYIQTDAAVNPGNSGGPLVNLKGEVIGINSFIMTNTGRYQGISFAIPMNAVRAILDRLIREGSIARGFLGVNMADITPPTVAYVNQRYRLDLKDVQELCRELGLAEPKGVFVASIERGSPAHRAGLREGDVIVRYGDKEVPDGEVLREWIVATRPGDDVPLGLIRNGKPTEATVKIGRRPGR